MFSFPSAGLLHFVTPIPVSAYLLFHKSECLVYKGHSPGPFLVCQRCRSGCSMPSCDELWWDYLIWHSNTQQLDNDPFITMQNLSRKADEGEDPGKDSGPGSLLQMHRQEISASCDCHQMYSLEHTSGQTHKNYPLSSKPSQLTDDTN